MRRLETGGAAPPRTGSGRLVCTVFVLLLALVSAPLFSTVLPPLFDYPNHLARMRLLEEGGNRFYAVHWEPLPNLAEDLIVPPLARLVPLELAGRLFLVMIFALVAGGALVLNRFATGGWRMWPLAVFLLLYNRTFLWGFLNYLFGIGVVLFGAALWLGLEARPARLRVLASSCAALVCFFSHLAAFGVYALTIVGIEAPGAFAQFGARRGPVSWRSAATVGAQFIIPAALLFRWHRQAGDRGLDYAEFPRKFDLLFSVFDNYLRAFDIACFSLFLGLLIWLASTGRLGLVSRLGWAVALVLAAYLALPSRIFGGSGLDHRLPVALFLLLVAGSAPEFPGRRATFAVAAAAGLMLALRMAVIEHVWLQSDRIYAADLAGIDALPAGARLAVAYPTGIVHAVAIPEIHLPAMATVRRDVFVPTVFAIPGQQPLTLRPHWAALSRAAAPSELWESLTARAAGWPPSASLMAQFDAIALIGRGRVRTAANHCLLPIVATPTFRIFAIRQGIGCGFARQG